MKPMLIILSAPSGAGKSTLCDRLLQDYPELSYSVSCTTRERRGEEEDGVDYHFVTEETFVRLVGEKAFLEHAKVHGNYYGTLAEPIRRSLADGLSVIMDIDCKGAAQVRARLGQLADDDPLNAGLVDIFIMPPSIDVLRERLTARGEDSPESIEWRLRNSADEMAQADDFRYRVVNDNLDLAYRELCGILEAVGSVNGPDAEEPPESHRKRKGREI